MLHKRPYNDSIFYANWRKIVDWLIPVPLRKNKFTAFINALISPVNDLHTRFIYYKKNVEYRLSINFQKCQLERALNDRFDIVQRRIRIINAVQKNAIPIFRKDENKPINLFHRTGAAKTLYTKSETLQFTVDFIIVIPVFVTFDQNEVIEFVYGYCLPSKKFRIQIV